LKLAINKEYVMKKLLLMVSLIAVATSPAFAKHSHKRVSHTVANNWYQNSNNVNAPTVMGNGQIFGRDPDPFIRFDLLRQGDSVWHSN
jgi:hypothetical protein